MKNIRILNPPRRKADVFEFCSKNDADYFVHGNRPWLVRKPEDVESKMRGYYFKGTDVLSAIPKEVFKAKGKPTVSGGVFWLNTGEIIECYEESKSNN